MVLVLVLAVVLVLVLPCCLAAGGVAAVGCANEHPTGRLLRRR